MLDAASHAAGLLAVSQALKSDMVALGMPADAIAVHYTGIDRRRFHPRDKAQARKAIAARFGLPAEGPLLATVGALIPRKGQALAMGALARLGGEARLALVGAGSDGAMLRRLAAELGVAARMHFLGPVSHDALPELLAAADAMVLPSTSEGLANAWVEALACGTPIVISDAGGAREVVNRPEAGRIAARDPEAIAAAVAEVLASSYSPDEVAQTVAGFSWEANAAALAAHYGRMLA
jgi:glycosyltransferase involved in cell wall biosynthesis